MLYIYEMEYKTMSGSGRWRKRRRFEEPEGPMWTRIHPLYNMYQYNPDDPAKYQYKNSTIRGCPGGYYWVTGETVPLNTKGRDIGVYEIVYTINSVGEPGDQPLDFFVGIANASQDIHKRKSGMPGEGMYCWNVLNRAEAWAGIEEDEFRGYYPEMYENGRFLYGNSGRISDTPVDLIPDDIIQLIVNRSERSVQFKHNGKSYGTLIIADDENNSIDGFRPAVCLTHPDSSLTITRVSEIVIEAGAEAGAGDGAQGLRL